MYLEGHGYVFLSLFYLSGTSQFLSVAYQGSWQSTTAETHSYVRGGIFRKF